LTLPSECVSLSRPGFEDKINPRRRRGGGNVGIGFIDFQGLWKGRKTAHRFPPFPQTVISTTCFDHLELSGGDLCHGIRPALLELHRADLVRVKASDAIEFAIHQSETSGMEDFLEAVHVEISGPDGKIIVYYSKNLSLVNGKAQFSLATALNDSPGIWTVRTSEPYAHQSSVTTFSVTR
jgi:hypothetical protein